MSLESGINGRPYGGENCNSLRFLTAICKELNRPLNLSEKVALRLGWTLIEKPTVCGQIEIFWENKDGKRVNHPEFGRNLDICLGKGGPLEALIDSGENPQIVASDVGFAVVTNSDKFPRIYPTLIEAVCYAFICEKFSFPSGRG